MTAFTSATTCATTVGYTTMRDSTPPAAQAAISRACKGSTSAFNVDATRQPTMRRENTSVTNAT